MDRSDGSAPDWRCAEDYAPLLAADRPAFAWEWLRRDPAYRDAAELALSIADASAGPGWRPAPRALDWGLHVFEAPDLSAPSARPIWRIEHHPFVLRARLVAAHEPGDRFDRERFQHLGSSLLSADGEEYLLLSDGLRSVRVDIASSAGLLGPVTLAYELKGIGKVQAPLLVLRRFLALCRTGRFASALHPREQRARRWVLALRAHDALVCGADQREMAAHLLSADAHDARWRVRSPSLRSQVQRLVRSSRMLANGGYRMFLR